MKDQDPSNQLLVEADVNFSLYLCRTLSFFFFFPNHVLFSSIFYVFHKHAWRKIKWVFCIGSNHISPKDGKEINFDRSHHPNNTIGIIPWIETCTFYFKL